MSYHKTVDPWQEAANAVQGIEGAQLKCSGKTGAWNLSGETVDTGREGLMIAVIMSTALHGRIRFDDGVVTRKPVRFEDAAPDQDEQLEKPWGPLTEALCVQLMTFTGASWGLTARLLEVDQTVPPQRQAGVSCLRARREGAARPQQQRRPGAQLRSTLAPQDRVPDLLPPETPRLSEPERRPLLTVTSGAQSPPISA